MEHIFTNFDLSLQQSDVDFIDVKLNDDNELFISPRLIEQSSDPAIKAMADVMYRYFAHLVLAVVSENKTKATKMLSGIHEPKETRLGYGKFNSNGKSSGPKLKAALMDAMWNSPLIRGKKLKNFGDFAFFVQNFNSDRLSDITTKIIEPYLIDFTQRQCLIHGIPLKRAASPMKILNSTTLEWEDQTVDLPVYNDGTMDCPITFVPKSIVWKKGDFNSNLNCFYRFARNYILGINDATFLEGVLRNGKDDTILVKDFDALNPHKKEALLKWVSKYQELPNDFWLRPDGVIRPLSDDEIIEVIYGYRNQKAA